VKRRLFNLAAAVSLVLCVATSVLWARSRRVQDVLQYQGRRWLVSLETRFGSAGVILWPTPTDDPGFLHETRPPRSGDWAPLLDLCVGMWRGRTLGGFGYSASPPLYSVIAPVWFIPAISAILPSAWAWRVVMRFRRKRRAALRLCPHCGYDLRATPQAGGSLLSRCPECGTEVKPQPAEGAPA
jgi:hypothetical protein